MFSNKPIKIAQDIEAVRRSAFWHLSRRDHSQAELHQKLQRKTDNNDWIEHVINECLTLNYLNDTRFTELFFRRAQNKGHGLARISQDLQRKGIDTNMINNIACTDTFDYVVSASRLLSTKYSEAIVAPNIKQKAMAFLQLKGHCFECISRSIEMHNESYPTPDFNDLEEAVSILSRKFKLVINDQKTTDKALRHLVRNGYDYSKSFQAIKLFNKQNSALI